MIIAEAANFAEEIWVKVGAKSCIKCHKDGGDAEETRFILQDPALSTGEEWKHKNWAMFQKVGKWRKDGKPLVLLKVTEEVEHEGGEIFKVGSVGYELLRKLVDGEYELESKALKKTDFFAGVEMVDDQRLLRRLTLSLAGRLPTASEMGKIKKGGLDSLSSVLDQVMEEDPFYERLVEGVNDIFLLHGVDGSPERILGYRNFGHTRMWYQKVTYEEIKDPKERQRAKYALADRYRESILHEPYALIEHIVRNNRPITELVTADYLMVSPYTAKGYGIFEELKDQFKDPKDHMEFIPAKLKQLNKRDGKPDQITPTGYYPHSGFLTTFHWLQRYPTTDTNRNRLRSRMYFQHFLGVDVMELAPRVSDAAAIDAKYEVPTMQAGECVVCHKSVDPIAGIFADYQEPNNDFGPYGPRKEGWFTDMFGPGARPDELVESEKWRAGQWLGQKTAKDPRFAVAMVEHVYYILTGRKVLTPPKDIEHPLFDFRQQGYEEQRKEVERIAQQLRNSKFNLKVAFQGWAKSKFYRAGSINVKQLTAERAAELDDLGLVRLLSPEQLQRKIKAVFGLDWMMLESKHYRILYGGIDSKQVTQRLTDPSGAMGAIQRIMANEVACKTVPADFGKAAKDRRLFPKVEPSDLPSENPEEIKAAVRHLHRYILGHDDPVEVERTYNLFTGILADAQAQGKYGQWESYFCRATKEEIRTKDPHYTVRSWRAVVTYLLRQPEFLYE